MGIAGTAPAFSVAATTATIMAAVGVLSVASIFYCGLVMFGIMLAFVHLSKIAPNAGAAYAWVGDVFGKGLGFFAGWGLLVASVFFMVSATMPAATSTLKVIAPDVSKDPRWVAITSALWLTIVTIVVTRGIKHASYTQVTLTVIETGVIFALIFAAFIQYGGKPAHPPSWTWISPTSFTPQLFAKGALIALFFYWGWDVTMNLTEETKEATEEGTLSPAGKGAFWAVVNLILFFCIMMIVVLIVLTDDEIQDAGTDVLLAVASKLFRPPWNYLAVVATLLSTIGTIETQLLQFSRSMFAMARDDMLHPRYAKIHPEWQTPWVATLVIWFLGMLLLLASAFGESVQQVLDRSINAIDFQICFYMSLAGFACAWHYRKKMKQDLLSGCYYVLFPFFSALFMVCIAIYCIPSFDVYTDIMGIGGLLLGFIPFFLSGWRRANRARAS